MRTPPARLALLALVLVPLAGWCLPGLGETPAACPRSTPASPCDPDGNDTPGTATVISVPHEGDYAIDPAGDIDWYRMELPANSFVHIYSERPDTSQIDPKAWFYGPHAADGADLVPTVWLAVNDDSHGDMQPDILFVVPEAGFYFLRIAHYANNPASKGNAWKDQARADTGEYRLFVQILPPQPDITIDPQTLDFALSPGDSAIGYVIVGNTGNTPLHVSALSVDRPWLALDPESLTVMPDVNTIVLARANSTGLGVGTHLATITATSDDPDESTVSVAVVLTVALPDSNDSPVDASAVDLPHTSDYAISPTDDIDWYRMYMEAGTQWLIYTERIFGSQIDPEAWFYGPHAADGSDVVPTTWIANDDDSQGSLQPRLVLSITESGYYFLRIAFYLNNPTSGVPETKEPTRAATGEYRLVIQPFTGAEPGVPLPALEFSVSPNPASRIVNLTLRLATARSVHAGIYDLSGRLLVEEHAAAAGPGLYVMTVPVADLSAGIYLCRLTDGKLRRTQLAVIRR